MACYSGWQLCAATRDGCLMATHDGCMMATRKIHIHFNNPCGQAAEVENDRRQYKIPTTGILLSQFADKQGFIDQQYYLVDNEPSRDILGVFHAGRVSSDGMYEFYVSTYRQLRDSFDFQYDKLFDLKEQKIINDCGTTKK